MIRVLLILALALCLSPVADAGCSSGGRASRRAARMERRDMRRGNYGVVTVSYTSYTVSHHGYMLVPVVPMLRAAPMCESCAPPAQAPAPKKK